MLRKSFIPKYEIISTYGIYIRHNCFYIEKIKILVTLFTQTKISYHNQYKLLKKKSNI